MFTWRDVVYIDVKYVVYVHVKYYGVFGSDAMWCMLKWRHVVYADKM